MTSEQTGSYKVALGALDTAGGVLSVVNPEGYDLIITDLIVDVITPSSGASTVDFGVGATATTSADTLLDGRSLATAGVYDNTEDQGTNGKHSLKWPADQYLTGSRASGACAGLVGNAHIKFIRA